MTSFELIFIIAGVTMAIPVVVAIVDSALEFVHRIRRHLPTRTTYAATYVRHTARNR